MPQLTQMILKAPPRRVEGFSNGNLKVVGIVFVHRKLRAGRAKIDPHTEGTTTAMVMDRALDYDVTSREPSEVMLQGLRPSLDSGPHWLGQREIARSNLNWPLHYACPPAEAIILARPLLPALTVLPSPCLTRVASKGATRIRQTDGHTSATYAVAVIISRESRGWQTEARVLATASSVPLLSFQHPPGSVLSR
jgi:hypothetical protein